MKSIGYYRLKRRLVSEPWFSAFTYRDPWRCYVRFGCSIVRLGRLPWATGTRSGRYLGWGPSHLIEISKENR